MLGDPNQTRQGYLCVASENQGVVVFYVRLDEGDDPPVYHDNGEVGDDDEDGGEEMGVTIEKSPECTLRNFERAYKNPC